MTRRKPTFGRYMAACGAQHLEYARRVFRDAGLHDERDFELLRWLMTADGWDNRWASKDLPEPTTEWCPSLAMHHLQETREQVRERLQRLGKAGVITRAGKNLIGLGNVRKRMPQRNTEFEG